jgi:hypothetical protein
MTALIFSIAFNGYEDVWARCIASHRDYASRIGADYAFIGSDQPVTLLMESTWLKIPLLLAALKSGRTPVLYLDADTMICPAAPDFRDVATGEGDLFMAKGFSGRVNAGVIMVRHSPRLFALLSRILLNAGINLPDEDKIGWGDNGEIIHFTHRYPGLTVLPREWNNNTDPNLPDFIRHFSAGPLRAAYAMTDTERSAQQRSQTWTAAQEVRRVSGSAAFFRDLFSLLSDVTANRDEFAPLDWEDVVAAGKNPA